MLKNFQAFQLAKELHWACKNLKVSRVLQDQLLRASSSVALNLAEGSGKRTPAEQQRFYSIALGSLRECEAVIELERIEDPKILTKLDQLGAILYTISRAPKNRTENPKPYSSETETETQTLAD